ncbi:hypothetical protein FC49_GL001525 [Limosilactobacillus oris DSM 4864]|uniref:Uncharacterized protein n=1 Tax=Limosilactobacillus oris DSM 4864 TaxID=1423779 RepID=A0A0R1WIL3_9LACO|nr:hypothetical protein FC49_GL001525 [Limosilactobacillus oris DSM 4864]
MEDNPIIAKRLVKEMMGMEQSSIIALSVKKYEELKKSKFSDKQIRKIAQIILACAADESHWP